MLIGYCGHYSLYLTILYLQLCQCTCHDNTLALLHRTRSTVGFWQRSIHLLADCVLLKMCFMCRYWVSIGLLLEHVRTHSERLWWPWTQRHVLQGEMERSYLSYLLNSDPFIRAMGGCQRISVVHVHAHSCPDYQLLTLSLSLCSLPMAVSRIILMMSSNYSRP